MLHLLAGREMIFVGLPRSERTRRFGSHCGDAAHGGLIEDEREQARRLDRRVAELAVELSPRT